MDVLYQVEDRDALRWTWNIWPSSRIEAGRMVVPLAAMYQPLKKADATHRVFYEPVQCKGPCKSFLNPYCGVDVNAKNWGCPFCMQRNQFPPHYHGMTATNLPAELLPTVTTIEYVLRSAPPAAPAYLFVVDTCLREEELQALKESLLQTLDAIPPTSYVGLITFGTTVNVYELAFAHCTKSFVFKGDQDVPSQQVQQLLGLGQPGQGGKVQPSPINNYVAKLEDVESNIQSILQHLQRDPRTVQNDKRPLRSTGTAVSVAISLLEHTFAGHGARIMVFMGGPATQGPGMVVSDDLKEPIRSHHNLNKETAKHVDKASKYFQQHSVRVAKNSHTVDLFSCSLDQTGLLEMRQLVKETGGLMVLADSFEHEIFKKSLSRIFDKDDKGDLTMALNATFEVVTSRELKVSGAVGHMHSLNAKNANVAETELGIGGTNAWRVCSMDQSTSLGVYFEIVNQHGNAIPKGQNGMVQFHTTYQTPSGLRILRVTTTAHTWADPAHGPRALVPGFDQEAAAALIARLTVWKSEQEDSNSIRWLDRNLIQLLHRFSNFVKNDQSSLQIPQEMSVYPLFMFYLRRGALIQVFNNSPDETVFFRYCLLRENVANALIMIQPTLDSYTLDEDPVPVPLSATSVNQKNVLVLDTFFHIIVHFGDTIAQWRKAGYHEQPEYENLKDLLARPLEDADALMKVRQPLPIYVECDQGTSQARFLLASIDPDVTHMNTQSDGQVVFTEDVNLQVFMEYLKKRVVEFEP